MPDPCFGQTVPTDRVHACAADDRSLRRWSMKSAFVTWRSGVTAAVVFNAPAGAGRSIGDVARRTWQAPFWKLLPGPGYRCGNMVPTSDDAGHQAVAPTTRSDAPGSTRCRSQVLGFQASRPLLPSSRYARSGSREETKEDHPISANGEA